MNLFDSIMEVVYNTPERCTCDRQYFKVVLKEAVTEPSGLVNSAEYVKFNINGGFSEFKVFADYKSPLPKNVFGYWKRRRLYRAYKKWLECASYENFTKEY